MSHHLLMDLPPHIRHQTKMAVARICNLSYESKSRLVWPINIELQLQGDLIALVGKIFETLFPTVDTEY